MFGHLNVIVFTCVQLKPNRTSDARKKETLGKASARVELATPGLRDQCSNLWAMKPMWKRLIYDKSETMHQSSVISQVNILMILGTAWKKYTETGQKSSFRNQFDITTEEDQFARFTKMQSLLIRATIIRLGVGRFSIREKTCIIFLLIKTDTWLLYTKQSLDTNSIHFLIYENKHECWTPKIDFRLMHPQPGKSYLVTIEFSMVHYLATCLNVPAVKHQKCLWCIHNKAKHTWWIFNCTLFRNDVWIFSVSMAPKTKQVS